MSNTKIRESLKRSKIAYWQVADILGVHENTIYRRLRKELSEKDRKEFEQAIATIKAEQGVSE